MSEIINKLKNLITDVYEKLKSVSGTLLITSITLVIIIFGILYYLNISTLKSRQCKKMTNRMGDLNGKITSVDLGNEKFSKSLKDYYIQTAYNCCSGGNYRNDYVDLCVLKNVLKQGVRGLDFEIFSINDKPVVATSTSDNYYVKETFNYIDFDDVMNIIENYAFAGSTCPNPNDPIFIHLRIKSNNIKMYNNFAKIFKKYNSILLGQEYSYEYRGRNLGNVPLSKLMGKVVIIVDRNNNTFLESQSFYEYVNMTSSSIFMREKRFSEIKSLSKDEELIEFNKIGMTICMPDKGNNPSNPNSKIVRETGSQFLAMRYQLNDDNLKENNEFFNENGFAFVLKPEKLRFLAANLEEFS
jgi:hypothetical protein